MKQLLFVLTLCVGLFYSRQASAQLSVRVNIGDQPAWAPQGYDDAPLYYIPDMDVYYDVPSHQFLYMSNRRWVRTSVLPSNYRRFDLYTVHKVPINDRRGYMNYDRDRDKYREYRGRNDQQPIRDSRDERYSRNRENWKNNRWHNYQQNNGNNNRDNNRDDNRNDNRDNGQRDRGRHNQ